MSFLSPLFLVGALAGAIPIVLHLLKRQPEAHVRFSAVRLLKSAPVETARKRHLRDLLLLALRVAALLVLAIAFARPFFPSAGAAASGITVIALDTSMSMSAPGKFEKARRLAEEAAGRAGAADLVSVVTFDTEARALGEPSTDRGAARAAIDKAHAGVGSTSYHAVLRAASDVLRGRQGTLVVVTDLQEAGWHDGERASVPASAHLEVADVGPGPENLVLTTLHLAGGRIVASVRNTGMRPRDARVRLAVNVSADSANATQTVGETTVPVGPGQSADVAFPAPRGRWASVVVDDDTGIKADNVRYLVLDENARPRVLIIAGTSRDAFYVEQALVVADGRGGGAYEVERASGADLQAWDQARLDAHAAIVLLSTRGLEHRGRLLLGEYVRKGGGVLIAAGPDIDGEVVSQTVGAPRIEIAPSPSGRDGEEPRALAPSDMRHPLFRAFADRSSLGLATFQRVATLRGDGCDGLARFTTGETAILDCEAEQGRVLIFASDLNNQWNDFPLRATFVPLIHEAVHYLSGTHRSSDYLVTDVPAGVQPTPGVVGFAPIAGAAPRLISVNVDPEESSAARLSPEDFQKAVARVQDVAVKQPRVEAREQEERQHIWQYALALVLMLLIAESLVSMRVV